MIKAVIWDCDGVLVDSETLAMPIAGEVIHEELLRLNRPGIHIPGFVQKFSGGHFSQMCEAYDLAAEFDRLDAIKMDRTIEALSTRVETFAGLPAVLTGLHDQKFMQAVATSSELSRVEPALALHKLDGFFKPNDLKHIYSAVDSLPEKKVKPDPAVYLHALKKLGLEPHEAVAVEDSISGATAAVRAGLPVIGYVGGNHIADRYAHAGKLVELGTFTVIDDYKDFMPALQMIIAAQPQSAIRASNNPGRNGPNAP